MYAVIAGGGKVGRAIASDLLEDGHQVTIIEQIPERTEGLQRLYDLLVIRGDATDVKYLQQARPERADVFVATTRNDDVNYVSCQLATITFGVDRVLSRVNSPRNEELFQAMGIEAVSTTTLISRLIREQATVGELIHLYTLRAGEVNLVEIDVPHDFASYRRNVAQLELPQESVLVCVFRGEDTVIPRGDTFLAPGDQVIALTTPELETALRGAILDPSAPDRPHP
ncbi:potassium channel family protein [Euzebya tangerina]|uniref:potassium channel family protein n=1 Tax=Euzebya tangerina TaxID=591198 RepID=UPI000E31359B|nr:NAD-binding protein [Euzebya tangerina]